MSRSPQSRDLRAMQLRDMRSVRYHGMPASSHHQSCLHRHGPKTCRSAQRTEDGVLTGHTLDDAGLIGRVARGDEDALGLLYDRFGRAVYSLCLRIVQDGATAEELTQEVFVRLWRSAASFEPAR